MSDDSDPTEEPTPSDGPDDGSGAGVDGSGASDPEPSGDSGDHAGDESVDDPESTDSGTDDADPAATDDEDEGTDDAGDWTTQHGGTDDATDADDTGADGDADDTGADGDADETAGVSDAPTVPDERPPYAAGGDGVDEPGRPDRGPEVEGVQRPATTASAGAPADGPTATGDGGVEGAATAAQKGMDAVNDGLGALGGDGGGPDSDQEMPLTEHIEEMMRRLSVVFAVGAVVSLGVLFVGSVSPTVPSAAEIIRFFWDAHVDFQQYKPHVYGPLEFVLTKLKVASLAGLLVGLPVFVHQTYLFMRPGLFPHERRYYLAAIPTSFVLGVVGATFAHIAVLPFVFDYFISYTKDTAILAFGLSDTFNLILLMMGYFAVVFQIPLFMQLAVMMNVVSRRWMEQRRLLFWGAFLGLAFTFIAADPTGFASIIVAATMIVLFEATLFLLRWTGN